MFRIFIIIFLFVNILSGCSFGGEKNHISDVSPQKKNPTFEIVVLPHHGITGKKMDEFYQNLVAEFGNFDRIIVLSPDHYGMTRKSVESVPESLKKICYQEICVPGYPLDPYSVGIPTGYVFSASGVTREHGIGEHILRISRFFPNTKVTPLILRRKLTPGREEYELAESIANIRDKRVLVIASVDFSHHVREEFAKFHDAKSIDVLNSGTFEDFGNLEVDCRNCLAVARLVAGEKMKTQFSLSTRTSVDTLLGSGSELENTSHIFGIFREDPSIEDVSRLACIPSISASTGVFLFAGDTHWARGFPYYEKKVEGYSGKVTSILYQKYDSQNDLQTKYHRLFSGYDDVIVNLESGIASDTDCPRTSKSTQMWTDPKYLPWLHSLGITLANVANNHSYDCGKNIFEKSSLAFSSGGITDFGYSRVAFRDIRGNHFAFIGINTIEQPFNATGTIDQIRTLTASGYLVVMNAHWGKEYSPTHNARQEKLAHDFVDAGARLVIGHHPHVVQDSEMYKGIPIYYSLGNFLFDQPFPETLRGLLVECQISPTNTYCEEQSIYRDAHQFYLHF